MGKKKFHQTHLDLYTSNERWHGVLLHDNMPDHTSAIETTSVAERN